MDTKTTDQLLDLISKDYPTLKDIKGIKAPDRYTYNGVNVPRVTSILDKTIGRPGIASWANSLGFKHIGYHKALNAAAAIGTETHNYIENYIQNDIKDITELKESESCIAAFHSWWDSLKEMYTVKVIGEEQKMTCPWYGGTYDLLLDINGEKMLVDFKTSNAIKPEYFYQLAAYRYLINLNYGYDIDSCMILRLSKTDGSYESNYIDLHTPNGAQFMQHASDTFFSLLNSYFRLSTSEYEYKTMCNGDDIV